MLCAASVTILATSSAIMKINKRNETLMTSLGNPLSDWLNENVSQLVAELVASVNGSVEQHGEYKFSQRIKLVVDSFTANSKHCRLLHGTRSCSVHPIGNAKVSTRSDVPLTVDFGHLMRQSLSQGRLGPRGHK